MPSAPKWINDTLEKMMASKIPCVKVIGTEYISPSIKKIRFQGKFSGMDFQLGYAVALRVSETQYRNYTVSFNDVEKGILEMIFHLHSAAPGSRFVSSLKVGDEIRISIPRGKKIYDNTIRKQLLFGDETSLGLASALQPVLLDNRHQFHFYFELDKENEDVPRLLGLENFTVFPKGSSFLNGRTIDDFLKHQMEAHQPCSFILTGNALAVQTLRKVIKQKNTIGKIKAQAYWAEGKTGL